MSTARRVIIAFGMIVTGVACAPTAMRGMPDYRDATLERVQEVPEFAAAGAAAGMMGNPFPGSCAQTLRVREDGRELRLMKARTETTGSSQSGTTTTRLVSAVGEYAVVTAEPFKAPLPRLVVDCVSGRATGWIGE